jgi:hypothetical protein
MWPCTAKLDKEKSNYVSLGKQNGFGPTFLLPYLLRLVKGHSKA